MSKSTILLVEDDADDVFFFERAWIETGAAGKLVARQNGADAVKYLAECRSNGASLPELVVSDLKMPVMDGFQLLAWLREQWDFRKLPVLMLSASTVGSDVQRAYALGAAGYIAKPNRYEDLRLVIRRLSAFLGAPSEPFPASSIPGWQPGSDATP